MEKVREKVLFALQEVQRAVIGKQEVTETVMKAFLAGGHVLVEDIPRLGKTTMAIAFSRAIGLQKRRVQFTPDVLPSDLTGFTIYQKERNAFVYHPGAVVCNLLLADEINRASPKTQSALLEVMEEGQVTVDGKDCSAVSGDRYGKSVRLRRDAVASGISVGSFYGLCKDGISDNSRRDGDSAKK